MTRYAVWHRGRGYGGPDVWTLITSYTSKPLTFVTRADALDYVREGLDTLRYHFLVYPCEFPPPPEDAAPEAV